ncbi:SDR family NAD(P)-dependent oxidoreductase [Paenibacillus cremeus]|uniref:Glucose 1-dehydrogenase n=1 Tax=Paenibacillus cremeus TaxID=2163881 RepID=A0A559K5X9_9BACL|nr:glucose 1-dehydrogenase [Paenibacillus cremeus]TVY07506.1 glucose 1-dehydrogenase [Paenibacillus cremeus]
MSSEAGRKVAIVTGGAQGIGAAVGLFLLRSGMKVVIADRSDELPPVFKQPTIAEEDVIAIRTDVTLEDDVARLMSTAEREFGGIDVLVNSAGIFPRATLLETTQELWSRVIDVNLKGVYLMCRAAVPCMIQRGGGAIINIGSLHARGGASDLFAYSVSKGGVVTLTMNLARSLAQHGIRVNCVHPGWVASEGEVELRRSVNLPDDWLEQQGKKLPLGRLQTTDDIAAMVQFLTSDAACQMTGQVISVDGGMSLK